MIDKVAATIDYLLKNTPTSIKSSAKSYEPELIRSTKNRWVYKVGDYAVIIKLVALPKMLDEEDRKQLGKIKNRDVLVSCTCRFWKWNGPDFNAFNNGYSERVFSNLSEPVERDPQNKFLICKHVYSALKQFKNEFK